MNGTCLAGGSIVVAMNGTCLAGGSIVVAMETPFECYVISWWVGSGSPPKRHSNATCLAGGSIMVRF